MGSPSHQSQGANSTNSRQSLFVADSTAATGLDGMNNNDHGTAMSLTQNTFTQDASEGDPKWDPSSMKSGGTEEKTQTENRQAPKMDSCRSPYGTRARQGLKGPSMGNNPPDDFGGDSGPDDDANSKSSDEGSKGGRDYLNMTDPSTLSLNIITARDTLRTVVKARCR